jgi:TRAP-type C4-dicarboxylate transport system permease small subunit
VGRQNNESGGNRMERSVERLLAPLGWLMAIDLIGMMMLTVVDVIGRYIFNNPIPGSAEVIGLMMGVLVFGTLPLASLRNEHILIDVLDNFLFPGARKRVQQVVFQFASALVVAFIAWRLWVKAAELASYRDATMFLQVPLAPMAYFMAILSGVTALVLLYLSYEALRGRLTTGHGSDVTNQAAG